MCLVIAGIFLFLGVQSLLEGDNKMAALNLSISIFFFGLMAFNIKKVIDKKKKK